MVKKFPVKLPIKMGQDYSIHSLKVMGIVFNVSGNWCYADIANPSQHHPWFLININVGCNGHSNALWSKNGLRQWLGSGYIVCNSKEMVAVIPDPPECVYNIPSGMSGPRVSSVAPSTRKLKFKLKRSLYKLRVNTALRLAIRRAVEDYCAEITK